MALVGGLITTLLSIPPVRIFFEDIFLRFFAEILFRSDQDPEFRKKFFELSSGLVNATTEVEKRAILVKMRDLRKPA